MPTDTTVTVPVALDAPSIDVQVRYEAEGSCPLEGCDFVAKRSSNQHFATAEQRVLDVLVEHVRDKHHREAEKPRPWCVECGRYDERHHPECTQWKPGKHPNIAQVLGADPVAIAERGKELLAQDAAEAACETSA